MAPATVLVTGANRGIGLGLVKKFLENKDIKKVIATARKPEEATKLKAISDDRLTILSLEVTCDKSIKALYAEVEKIVGDDGLTLLVNNAGIFVSYDVKKEIERSEIAKAIDTNTISPVIITQVFLPLLLKAASHHPDSPLSTSRAAIINISSTAGSIASNDPEVRRKVLEARGKKPLPETFTAKMLAYRVSKVEESTDSLVKVIYNLKEEQTGGYFNHKGEVIPY